MRAVLGKGHPYSYTLRIHTTNINLLFFLNSILSTGDDVLSFYCKRIQLLRQADKPPEFLKI